jgi:hypothetical protein
MEVILFFIYNFGMGKRNIWKELKLRIGAVAFGIFIWSMEMTDDEYFDAIYEQEKRLKEKTDEQED